MLNDEYYVLNNTLCSVDSSGQTKIIGVKCDTIDGIATIFKKILLLSVKVVDKSTHI